MYPSLGTPNLEQSCFRLQNPSLYKFLRTPLMLCEQITRFAKSETMGIVTELRSTCVKLGCRVKN